MIISNNEAIFNKPHTETNSSLKKAFTLAELLITLAIVGVVAALTLPTLISKIQDRQNIAKWRKEYSVINNAFQQVLFNDISVCENYSYHGFCTAATGSTGVRYFSDKFIENFKQKLSIVDYCVGTTEVNSSLYAQKCDNYVLNRKITYNWAGINGVYSRYKSLETTVERRNSESEYGIQAYNFLHYALLLSDGAVIYLGGLWNGPWIVVDVNSFNQGPNEVGRDVFIIKVFSDKITNKHYLKPAGAKDTPNWQNPESGSSGCDKNIGLQTGLTIYDIAGAGCSAKYLSW